MAKQSKSASGPKKSVARSKKPSPSKPPSAKDVLKDSDPEAMRHIMDLVESVSAQDDADGVYRALVGGIREFFGFDRAGMFLWDETAECFRGTYGTSLDGETVAEHHLYWSVVGWKPMPLIRKGEQYIVEEMDRPTPAPGEERLKAYLVPLRAGKRLYGLVSVDNRMSRRPVSEEDLHYVSLLGRILGNAVSISPESRYAEMEKGYETLCRIIDLLGHVTAQETVDDICRAIVEGVRTILGYDRAGLHLWYNDLGEFHGTFGTDLEGNTSDEHDLWWKGEGWPPMEKINRGDTFIVEELDQPPPRPGEEKLKAHMVVLRFGDQVYGILSVDNRISRRSIPEHEMRYLTLFSRIVGNAVEISRAKTDAARSATRFRQVAENSREWIWELDSTGRYTYCSPIANEILGYSAGTLVGRPFMDFVSSEDREATEQLLANALAKRQPIHRYQHRQIHADGHVVILETSGLPVFDTEKNVIGYRGAHRDITHAIDREEQLRQAQKMEAIGQLAGGMAHHFNNLLTVILGCTDLITYQVEEGSPVRREVEQIKDAGEQAASLTRQLLAFSRKQMLVVRKLNVNTVLFDIDLLLRRAVGEDIEMVTRFAEEVDDINADADQLKHMVLRLAMNGRSAIREALERARAEAGDTTITELVERPRESSQVIIETSNVALDADYCDAHENLIPGRYVLVSVSDTGVGMPDEVREHIFEPFFTTKEVGSGTGLGLSSVYGAMKQMDGHVEVESSPGEGTTFKLFFRVAEEPPQEEAASRAS